MAVCSAMLSLSLVERRLMYSATCFVRCCLLSSVVEGNGILCCGLCQIVKCHGHYHGVVCGAGVVISLKEGLMTFLQVSLRFNEIYLERCPGLFLIRFGLPGLSVLLEFPRFRDEVVVNADDFHFCDRLDRRGRVIDALVQIYVEAFEGLFRIVVFPELPLILGQIRCQYTCVVRVQMA